MAWQRTGWLLVGCLALLPASAVSQDGGLQRVHPAQPVQGLQIRWAVAGCGVVTQVGGSKPGLVDLQGSGFYQDSSSLTLHASAVPNDRLKRATLRGVWYRGSQILAQEQQTVGDGQGGLIQLRLPQPTQERVTAVVTLSTADQQSTVRLMLALRYLKPLDELLRRYRAEVPPGLLLCGPYNNVRSWFSGTYHKFRCGGYQDTVLAWLTKLRFSSLPEDRYLVEDWDYGPIESLCGWHQAVVLYPAGSDWMQQGMVLDPWPKQKPEVYTMSQWCLTNRLARPSQTCADSGRDFYPLFGKEYQREGTARLSLAD